MPKRIQSSGRKIVLSVREFCQKEKDNKGPLIPFENVRQRVAAITGISEKTVSTITKEGEASASTSQKVTTPRKKRDQKKKIVLDDFDLCAIRNKIHEMYTVRKEVPTLSKLLVELKDDISFQGGRTTLWKIIRKIGFRFKKCGSKRKVLMERHDIVAWRYRYLNILQQNRNEGRPVVFLDETYIHASYGVKKCWQSENEEGVMSSDSVGARWIIVHAGGEMGFIPGALLIFKSQSKSGDYHDDMNKTNFMKWLQDKLIPNLPPNCLIVMDNAPYHTVKVNKAPTLNSTKVDMQNWIINKGLSYLPNMVKAQLYEIIREHKEVPIYEADRLLETHGHKVASLPPYHCDLNAIEFMWSLVKRRVASHNVGQEATNIVKLTQEAFQSATTEEWRKQCEHVRHIEDKLSKADGCMDAEIDKFIIELNNESDTESDSVSENSSSADSDCAASAISLEHSYSKLHY